MIDVIDASDPTAMALARAVEGQFALDREIGRGGMGVVYLATDIQLDRHVAIKTLPPHLAADAMVRGRFVREARTAAALSHPGIVPVYHAAERDGVVYFAMGYVPGESLAERITRSGPVSVAELTPLLIEVAGALAYAHGRGVVHRDIKAENVLIDSRTGRAMLTDFGIARVTEAQPTTATGTVLGTVHYMSPEQVIGEPLDGRSDLYAVGVLAFYAATGRFPIERATAPAVLVAHVNSAPPRLHEYAPDAPDWLDALIARLLEKQPSDRVATGEELAAALERGQRGQREGAGADGFAYGDARGAQPVHALLTTPRNAPGAATHAAADHPLQNASDMPLSADEAHAVWARAAELQANTGVLVPPPQFALGAAIDAGTRGYDASMVRASAEEAGIPVRYVDRALAERAASAAVVVTPGEAMSRKPNLLAGGRTRVDFESVIDGELTDEGFEEIADEVRRALGELVTVSAVGRTLSVSSTATIGRGRSRKARILQVHIASRNNRTRVHAFEDLGPTVGLTFGLGVGAVGGSGGGILAGALMGTTQSPMIALSALGAWMATAYLGARAVYARTSRKRADELRQLVERVVICAQKHVHDTSADGVHREALAGARGAARIDERNYARISAGPPSA